MNDNKPYYQYISHIYYYQQVCRIFKYLTMSQWEFGYISVRVISDTAIFGSFNTLIYSFVSHYAVYIYSLNYNQNTFLGHF